MKIVSYKTKMNQMPDNCIDCTFTICPLPLTKDEEFRAECRVTRHKDCPLITVQKKGGSK